MKKEKEINVYKEEIWLDAVKDGRAIDVRANYEQVRTFMEDTIGYMRDEFYDIDKRIEDFLEMFKERGICFWTDIQMSLYNFQAVNLNKYLKNKLQRFDKQIQDKLNDNKMICKECEKLTGGKCYRHNLSDTCDTGYDEVRENPINESLDRKILSYKGTTKYIRPPKKQTWLSKLIKKICK